MSAKILRFATAPALAREASARFLAAAREAIDARRRFCVVLPGRRTPVLLFSAQREEPLSGALPWDRTHVLFTDERCVPVEDGSSHFGLAKWELLDHVPVPLARVHRVPVEAGAPAARVEPICGAVLLFTEAGV